MVNDPAAHRRRWLLLGALPLLAAGALACFFLLRGRADPADPRTAAPPTTRRLAAPIAPAAGGIEGRVLDASGRPVAGARVAASAANVNARSGFVLRLAEARPALEVAAAADSDEQGRFRLPGLTAGSYRLTATAPGRTAGHHRPLVLPADQWIRDVELRVGGPGFTVQGRVLDLGGGPVSAARLRAIRKELVPSDLDQLVFETASDAQGRYALQLPPGRYALWAEADGYARAHDHADVDAAETRDIRLQPAGVILGRVVGADGEVAPGATVHAEPLDRPDEDFGRAAITDEQGRFTIGELVAGTYRLVARQAELVGSPAAAVRLSVASREDGIEIRLAAGVTLEGTVKDRDGEAIATAAIWAVPEDLSRSARPVHQRVQADEMGRFQLGGLLPGFYRVRAHADGWTAGEEGMALVKAGVSHKDLILDREIVVAGEVRDAAGKPVAGAWVEGRVKPLRPGPLIADRVRTDEQGQFSLHRLSLGELRLSARSDAGVVNAPPETLTSAADGGKRRTLRLLGGGRLSGVVSWDDGKPAASILVVAQSRSVGLTHVIEARSDAQGRFSAGPLPAGDVSLHAVPPSERAGLSAGEAPQVDLVLDEGEHEQGVKLSVLRRSESVGGVVMGPDGPVSDAVVYVEKERDGLPSTARAQGAVTGPDGSFTIESLGAGEYTLTARHPRYAEIAQRGVVAGRSPVRLVFQPGGTLAGVVVKAGGEPLTSYLLVATPVGGPTGTGRGTVGPGGLPPVPAPPAPPEEIRSPTGQFELSALRPGDYRLSVVAPDGSATEGGPFTVAAGQSRRDLRLVVSDGRTVRVLVKDFTSGRGLSGAVAELRTPGGTRLRAQADERGQVVLDDVPAVAGLSVMVRGPDPAYAAEHRELPAGERQSDVDLGQMILVKEERAADEPTAFAPLDFVPQGDRLAVTAAVGPETLGGARLVPGDLLLAIDGRDARGLGPNGVRHLIGGRPSSQLVLTVEGSDRTPREVKIPRLTLQ